MFYRKKRNECRRKQRDTGSKQKKEIHEVRGLNKEEDGRWKVGRTEAETAVQVRAIERDNRKRKTTIVTIWEGEKHLKILTKELGNGGGAGRGHRKMRVCYKPYPCVGWEP